MVKHKAKILFSVIYALVLAAVFLIPETTYAVQVEPLFKVLSTTGVGDQIKQVWNQVLAFINSLAVAVLIFIAFANILRININNYGIKKFLPTLVLTIIAANFSYLICRLLVDLANVGCDLLINGTASGATTAPTGDLSASTIAVSGAFDFTKQTVKQFSDYPRILFIAILEFVGAIFILILAFLFFIRNYIIYFLVALSPIAFVSLSLPQTKTAFNQWWSMFWKWTFLPIVSLFWLWVAGRWIGTIFPGAIAGSSTLIAFAFAAVCYYLAITTPFKMGGGIMQQWGNLGKRAWGATGGKVADYYKAKNAATWGARWQNVQNLVKDKAPLNIGKGLDMAQQKLADAQTRRGLLQDEGKAAYIQKAGKKRALWQVQNMSKEGSSSFAEKGQLAGLITETDTEGLTGRALRRAERSNALVDRVKAMRMRSQEAILDLAIFDANWTELNNDMKTRFLTQKDAAGNPIEEESTEYKRREAFYQRYANSLWQSQVSELESGKAAKDPIKKAAEERIALDNLMNENAQVSRIIQDLDRLVVLNNNANRTQEEQAEFEQLQASLAGRGYNTGTQQEINQSREMLDERADILSQNMHAKVRQYQDEEGNVNIPLSMRDMVTRGPNGQINFEGFATNIERSRTGMYVSSEIKEGGATMADKYSARELANFRINGAEAEEGIDRQAFINYNRGLMALNDADTNRKIQEIVEALDRKLTNNIRNPENPIIVEQTINAMRSETAPGQFSYNNNGLREIARSVNEYQIARNKPQYVIDDAAIEQGGQNLLNRLNQQYGGDVDQQRGIVYGVKSSRQSGHAGSSTSHIY